jgi:branched-chain amino acid transport system ATP-binding protein
VAILTSLPAHIGYIIIEHDLDVALRVVRERDDDAQRPHLQGGTPDEIERDPEVQAIYLGGGHG